MRLGLVSILCLLFVLDGSFAQSTASPAYFLVAEWPAMKVITIPT